MAYEMSSLLMKCGPEDFAFLVEQIESYVSLTDDKGLQAALAKFSSAPTEVNKKALAELVEREIRYVGSSEIGYAYRKLTSKDPVAGVGIHEMIDDACKQLKIKVKPLGSVESKLEQVVGKLASSKFFSMKPDEQRELLRQAKLTEAQSNELLEKIKANKAALLPLLRAIIGPEATLVLLEGLVINLLAAILGKEAAKALTKAIIARMPWLAEFLGPIAWGVSLAWWAVDLQGPATRKIVPIFVFLGVVGLRDGVEEGEAFFNEGVPDC